MNSYPIILAHGITHFDFLIQKFSKDLCLLGLDKLGLANDGLNYFKGIARYLRDNGFDVYQSSVSFGASVERRASELAVLP
ncbi:MAG: hypothetical protein ACR2HG_13445 [Pyrinomonadaceae bacterium]